MDLKSRTIKGVKWSGIGQLLANGADFVIYAILARILFPEDFGVFAMATVFTGFVSVINQLGMETAIIQRKDINESHLSTSFWFILVFGIFLSLMIIGVAPLLANHFTNELVQPVLMALSLNFIATAFGFVHYALLQRWIEFKKIAIIEISTILIGGTASIIMALNGWGVWSLVWGWVGQSMIRSAISWVLCKWRPKMIVDLQSFKELFAFGKNIVGSRISTSLSDNIIYLLIGRVLGESTLGIYSFAYKLSHLTATKFSRIISRVALPTFSSIQDDDAAISWIYQKKIKCISLICFPLLFGMLTTAPRFIEVIYGYKWRAAIIPLQMLCVMSFVKTIICHSGTVIISKGRPDVQFKWNVVAGITYPLFLLIGLKYEIIGVCISLTIATFILYFIIQYVANSMIYLSTRDFIASLYPATLSSVLMTTGILIYEKFYGARFDSANVLGFIIPVILGVIIYAMSVRFIFSSLHSEIKEILLSE